MHDLNIQLLEVLQQAEVADLLNSEGDLSFTILAHWLPVEVMYQITYILPPNEIDDTYFKVIFADGNKEVGVSNMYNTLDNTHNVTTDRQWKRICKLILLEIDIGNFGSPFSCGVVMFVVGL